MIKASQVIRDPHLLQSGKNPPDGWTADSGIVVEWVGKVVLNLEQTRYEGVIFRKGEKECYLPWNEIETRGNSS